MPPFWILAGTLLATVVGRLLWLALRPDPAMTHASGDFLRTQSSALQRATAAGELAADQVPAAELELAHAALDDAARASKVSVPTSERERAILAMGVALLVPLIGVSVYALLGTPSPPTPVTAQRDHPSPAQMIAELRQRIEQAPKDPEARTWLARVYMTTHDYPQAVAAFEALYQLVPDEPAVLVEYADALTMTEGGQFKAKANALITHALEIEPNNVTALWLAGLAADQAGRAPAALDYLARARAASITRDLPTSELDTQIAALETRSGLKAKITAPPPIEKPIAATAASIKVEVTLAAALAAKVPAGATLFILAKNPAGPPMPLAVKRLKASELPLSVVLDDSLAMAPQFKLSTAREVIVTARISASGQALPSSGDLQGSFGPVTVGAGTLVKVEIKEVVP